MLSSVLLTQNCQPYDDKNDSHPLDGSGSEFSHHFTIYIIIFKTDS
jgi:hypothetical protein